MDQADRDGACAHDDSFALTPFAVCVQYAFVYNIHALFPPEPIGPPDLAERLGPILLHLRRAAADRAVKYWAYVPLGLLFAAYLSSVMRRVESLVARHRAGRLRARPSRPRTVQPQEERENAFPKRRLPARFGWVVEWLGHHAAGCAAQLRHMLTHDPDLVALLDAGPQAGRVLRPLCRMLGMEPGPDLPPSLFPSRAAKLPASEPAQSTPPRPDMPGQSLTSSPLGEHGCGHGQVRRTDERPSLRAEGAVSPADPRKPD